MRESEHVYTYSCIYHMYIPQNMCLFLGTPYFRRKMLGMFSQVRGIQLSTGNVHPFPNGTEWKRCKLAF